jgi:Carboxypeptidase regulatory-like domain
LLFVNQDPVYAMEYWMVMRKIRSLLPQLVSALLVSVCVAHAATITGTVTNKTSGKPSAGDNVELVDVQAGMADAASATTDAHGHYSLESPGMGPYLIRVTHQGGAYFIAAPQGGSPGDVTVYDVAAKVEGITIDADMMLVEAAGGMLRVQERYLVRNTSLPPRAQFSSNTFEIVLPQGAELDGAAATRPGGLATNTRLIPLGQSGHYTFNVPIQPDQGEKETMFEVQYHLSYDGKFTFTPHLQMPADNLVVYVPKGMTLNSTQGASFQSTQEDPRVQTFVAKGIHPGDSIAFAVSGEGQMPRQAQGGGMGPQAGGSTGDVASNRPGGGIGTPIDTPDPLSKYKWWLLAGIAVLLVAGAGYLLRNRNTAMAAGAGPVQDFGIGTGGFSNPVHPAPESGYERQAVESNYERPATHTPEMRVARNVVSDVTLRSSDNAALLNILKEEMFAVESEKLDGTLSAAEYAEVKAGLEAVLKRALKKKASGERV